MKTYEEVTTNIIVKDSTERSFDQTMHEEFKEFLRDVDEQSEWCKVPLNSVEFVSLRDSDSDILTCGDEETYTDTYNSLLPLAVKFDGYSPDVYAIRPYLWKLIREHHEDNAKILNRMLIKGDYAAICDHLNSSRPYLTKDINVLLRGTKISGWFGDFNHAWNQSQQVDFFESCLEDSFPNAKFISGNFSHLCTQAWYQLDNSIMDSTNSSDAVMKSYIDAWRKAGFGSDIETAIPVVRFATGESGLFSITVSPYIYTRDNRLIPLGPSMSVNHRGRDEAVWGKFAEFPGQIASSYQKGFEALTTLCDLCIFHPYSCTTHVLKDFCSSVPKVYIRELLESTELFYDPDSDEKCNAIDIFNSINDMVAEVNSSGKVGEIKKFTNLELVSRLLTINWEAMDVKKPLNLIGKNSEKSSSFSDYSDLLDV
jgi:hypothetical protein